ncbi:MAG: winged helix-turn-helix transcriptional regulator, partial [Gammaproteobacteria bacterium]|nr:winged helix-turn-helix transcriptional regulator [Gammaproteobacteria bacterium]
PSCACMLKEVTGLPDSRLSYHLTNLKKAGLISGDKEKNWIIYSLTDRGEQILLQINLVEIIK